MPPRRRKPDSAKYPAGLYKHAKGGWRLLDARTRREKYLNPTKYSEAQAIGLARALLAEAAASNAGSLARTIDDYIDYLATERKLAATTISVYRYSLAHYREAWGRFRLADVKRGLLMEYWRTIGPHAWQKHRTIWVGLFRWAISEGFNGLNEAELARPPEADSLERKTERHTVAGLARTRAKAAPWLQKAIDLFVYSLQDRSTVLAALRADVRFDADGVGYWDVTRLKKEKRSGGEGAHLTLVFEPESKLYSAVRSCLDFEVVGSSLLRRPARRKVKAVGRSEWSQVMPNYLSAAFRKARDSSGAYDELPVALRPGIHALRAHGANLYRKAGFSEEDIQALCAHESVKMTQHYLAGHEGEAVERVTVKAGLI